MICGYTDLLSATIPSAADADARLGWHTAATIAKNIWAARKSPAASPPAMAFVTAVPWPVTPGSQTATHSYPSPSRLRQSPSNDELAIKNVPLYRTMILTLVPVIDTPVTESRSLTRTPAGHAGWRSESGSRGSGLVTLAPGRLRENVRPALRPVCGHAAGLGQAGAGNARLLATSQEERFWS